MSDSELMDSMFVPVGPVRIKPTPEQIMARMTKFKQDFFNARYDLEESLNKEQ